ncbi:hypothetical protein DL96DRAFT_1715129 [Flagelloscypha sp. PMI_526]|nr:hypothetical protein DL96DRAFT_1715129 [Flagelloscypha sp. PMI_526]
MAPPLSDAELRTNIALGSYFLAAMRWSGPSILVPRLSTELKMLQHLTTLLTSRSGVDARDRVVAVAGPATRNGLSALLVTQNCGPDDVQSEKMILKEIKPSSESCDAILSSWDTRSVDNPDNCVADLLKILVESELGDKRLTFYALRYSAGHILYRCSLTWNIWRKGKRGPFGVIADRCSDFQPTLSFPWEITIPLKAKKYLKDLLPKEYYEANGQLHFLLEKSELKGWADFIEVLLTNVQEILGAKRNINLRVDLGVKEFKQVAVLLFVLKLVLDAQVLDKILTDPSLCRALEETRKDEPSPAQSRAGDHGMTDAKKDTCDEEDLEEDAGQDGREEEDEEDVSVGQSQGQHRHRLLRHLYSLSAWSNAITKLQAFVRICPTPPAVHCLTITSSNPKDSLFSHLSDFIQSVVIGISEDEGKSDIRDELERVMTKAVFSDKSWGKKTTKDPGPTSYHTEAIAIALGAAVQHDKELPVNLGPHLQTLQTLFLPHSKTSIGANNKCCWFCWQLCQAYKKSATVYDMAETHGKVYPWDPPPFGISASILEEIWNNTKEAILKVACNLVQIRRAPQWSVGPKSEVLPMNDLTMILLTE